MSSNATSKFRKENPKIYGAFVSAFEEAINTINRDKRAAAETYLRISRDKDTVGNILRILNDPDVEFTMAPKGVMQYVNFMYKTGSIKVRPETWKELFFPDVHNLEGS